jgi:TonB family protein
MRTSLLGALALVPSVLAAQSPARFERVKAPLFDLVVFSDSTYGVQLLASPNFHSQQGYKKASTNRLALLISDIEAWTGTAGRLLDSPPLTASTSPGKYPGLSLAADRGRSAVTLGYDQSAAFNERFFLLVSEVGGSPWRAALPDSAARALVQALARAGAQSAIRAVDDRAASRALLECEVDEAPRITKWPKVRYPNIHPYREGRVWVQFVVDTTGRADSTSIDILLSDDPAFEKESRSALRAIRFSPGRRAGAPVPVLVFQQLSFRVRS